MRSVALDDARDAKSGGERSAHTSGRWTFHGWPNLPRVSTPDGKSICGVHKIGRFSGTVAPEVIANGYLIAAAPDLLAALKAVVAVADRRTVEFDAARAAIAKAEDRADG